MSCTASLPLGPASLPFVCVRRCSGHGRKRKKGPVEIENVSPPPRLPSSISSYNIQCAPSLEAGRTEFPDREEETSVGSQEKRKRLVREEPEKKKETVHVRNHQFVDLLKACARRKDLEQGSRLHNEIERRGLLMKDAYVGCTLVHMYAKCGALAKAKEVFIKLPQRNVVSWNVLMSGYVQHGQAKEALEAFEQMRVAEVPPDAVTFVCSLKACASIGAADKGREIHADIDRSGLLRRNIFVGTALVDMYAKCGLLAKAQEVFDQLPVRNMVTWNALIVGYTQHGYCEEALKCFEQMRLDGLSPDAVTYVCSLKACGRIQAISKGRDIHAEIVKRRLFHKDTVIGNALVGMYAECGLLTKAQEVFNKLPARDVVSWNALIAGYTQNGCCEEALKLFEQMQSEGHFPDAITFLCSLKACANMQAIDKGEEIHENIVKKGMLENDLVLGNALIDMYAKCGALAKAQEVFDKVSAPDVISWNALISGYSQHGYDEQALKSFEQMQLEGISPDTITFLCSLKACTNVGALEKGREIHDEIARKGLLETEVSLGTAVVDMYAKFGLLVKAQEVFDKLPIKDLVSWNALMAGYARLGEVGNVFFTFNKMINEGINPLQATFGILLNTCSHAGLVSEGQMYFESMSNDYGLKPTFEHYTCMIDLLGRAGQLGKAIGLINKMPFAANLVVWNIVLGACRKWGNVELGRQVFECALQIDDKDSAAYICMFNIYCDAGLHEQANMVEAMRVAKQKLRSVENGCELES